MLQNIAGYQIDAYTRDEAQADLKAAMGHHFSQVMREWYRGMKLIKLPVVFATATSTFTPIPTNEGAEPVVCGPQQGYLWSIKRITITTSGNDQGAVTLLAGSDPFNTSSQFVIDSSLNIGHAYYPGKNGLILNPGEQLYAVAATVVGNVYRLTGTAVEVPAEMVGKIL